MFKIGCFIRRSWKRLIVYQTVEIYDERTAKKHNVGWIKGKAWKYQNYFPIHKKSLARQKLSFAQEYIDDMFS